MVKLRNSIRPVGLEMRWGKVPEMKLDRLAMTNHVSLDDF
jgi:hypothetical protein